MRKFLNIVAQDLYHKYGEFENKLPEIAVVFPNNRAKLFFSEELFKVANRPTWSPSFLSIGDIFSSQSEKSIAEPMTLNIILYKSYTKIFAQKYPNKKVETLDEFYLWGDILLHDFDDIDKNLVNAIQLFTNIREQESFTDTLEHLSEDQINHIKRFFINFNPQNKTKLKEKFIENWNILKDVYFDFQESLKSRNIAYEGMLNREVIENIEERGFIDLEFKKYVFVGFNVLNKCETSLFKKLTNAGKALFYWDYDNSYMKSTHEAGRFMIQNLENFHNELPPSYFNNFNEKKNIQFISASTENAQARFVTPWIRSKMKKEGYKANETAIILCNENLLTSVIHSIPDENEYLNVTMGFPLKQTQIASLVKAICNLHLHKNNHAFFYKNVISVLQHPLMLGATKNWINKKRVNDNSEIYPNTTLTEIITKINNKHLFYSRKEDLCNGEELLDVLFKDIINSNEILDILMFVIDFIAKSDSNSISEPDSDSKENKEDIFLDPLKEESLFRAYTLISEIKQEMTESLEIATIVGLIDKAIRSTTVPYSGEPVRGLQVMGMLETRNLDFKNVLMLSVNEDLLPKKDANNSFIPYNLKKGFGMTTFEYQDSIYSFYFYRILQRAENITLMYNTATEGTNSGEMSRFMLQMLIESNQKIENYNVSSNILISQNNTIEITKDEKILNILRNKNVRSPSSLNTYMNCPLQFYLSYVVGIKENQDDMEDEITNRIIGNIFHNSAEFIYYDIIMRKSGLKTKIKDCENNDIMNAFNESLSQNKLRKQIELRDLEEWINKRDLKAVAEYFLLKEYFNITPKKDITDMKLSDLNKRTKLGNNIKYNGEQTVKLELITSFLKRLLEIDMKKTPFFIEGLEVWITDSIQIETNSNEKIEIKTGGIIDRLDRKDNVVRVLDYKTGSEMKKFEDIEHLFIPEKNRNKYAFQTFLYSHLIKKKFSQDTKIKPELLYIQKAANADYESDIIMGKRNNAQIINDITPFQEEFVDCLKKLLLEIYDPNRKFTQAKDIEACTYCPFREICKR